MTVRAEAGKALRRNARLADGAGGAAGSLAGTPLDAGSGCRRQCESLRLTSLDIAVNEGGELRFRQRADLGGLDVAVLEQHQRRDAADAELRRRRLVLVDVDLGDFEAALRIPWRSRRGSARSTCRGRTTRPSSRPAPACRTAELRARTCRRSRDECVRSWFLREAGGYCRAIGTVAAMGRQMTLC